MTDIIDDIDRLVDEQLSNYGNRSGYDYNINQVQCRTCGDQWHGLSITRTMHQMQVAYSNAICGESFGISGLLDRAESRLSEYRHADDDSEILCPGSEFIGPWATSRQLRAIRAERQFRIDAARRAEKQIADWNREPHLLDLSLNLPEPGPIPAEVRNALGRRMRPEGRGQSLSFVITDELAHRTGFRPDGLRDPMRRMAEVSINGNCIPLWQAEVLEAISSSAESFRDAAQQTLNEVVLAAGRSMRALADAFQPEASAEPDTPQQRALPRPSTTPPMWANDPTRSRRPRRNRSQPNRQGIA